MPGLLNESDWNLLLRRIRKGKCTAFLGAGACYGVLPLGVEIAQRWAKEHHYPLEDCHDLTRVAQYLATIQDDFTPKELVADYIEGHISNGQLPDFNEADEPHAVLADLPLPLYITTNYDDFMVRALKHRMRNPKQVICRWNESIRERPSVFESEKGFEPTAERPVVFHLHGHYQEPNSIVLTEHDYLDFIVNVSKEKDIIIPAQIQDAFTGTSLLFLGYRIADWDFRVLFRSLITYMGRSNVKSHVSVQLVPLGEKYTQQQKERAQEYLHRYFDKLDIRVYWGTCREFAAEIRRRWREFSDRTTEGT